MATAVPPWFPAAFGALLSSLALAASAQTNELDALSLEAPASAEPAKAKPAEAPTAKSASALKLRAVAELAAGSQSLRYEDRRRTNARASLNLDLQARLGPGWSARLANRIDHEQPVDATRERWMYTLKEGLVSWQADSAVAAVDLGRVSLRNGPGYGYNPTDFFKAGSLRTLTTVDPIALRDNRMGTFMLRGQAFWSGGGASLALAPKLADQATQKAWSLDAGATNARDQALLAVSQKLGEGISVQGLAHAARSGFPAWGANATAALGEAVTVHAEWATVKSVPLLAAAGGIPAAAQRRNQLAAGLTAALPRQTTLTLEYQYNGLAPDGQTLDALGAADTPLLVAHYTQAGARLETAQREAWLAYVSHKGLFGVKSLDLTALARYSPWGSSWLTWLELRHHWSSVDLAFQHQSTLGSARSEYGILPVRNASQLVLTWFF